MLEPSTDDVARPDLIAGCIAGVAAAALLSLGTLGDSTGASLAFLLVGAVASLTVPHLTGVPRPIGSVQVLALVTVLLTGVGLALPSAGNPRWVSVVLAVGLAMAFLHELRRTDGRRRLVSSIAGTCFGMAILACGIFYAAAANSFNAHRVAPVCAFVAVVVTGLVLRGGGRVRLGVPQLLAAALIGVGCALLGLGPWGALAAAMSALVAWALTRVTRAELLRRAKPPIAIAAGIAPVLASGVLVYAGLWLRAHIG